MDTVRNIVYGTITHLSYIAPAGKLKFAPDLSKIFVSPNPFVPSRGHTVISFLGAELPYSEIKIYNKAAELVRTLEEKEGKTRLDWDATSSDGKRLASGVYIWVSTNQAGKHEKGKFAIIR